MKQARVRAPELVGAGGWLNTGGKDLSLGELRGKIVLLDFWTFCCVNCLHVLDELRPLEQRFADVLVVVGVHSPKFAHEADHDAVAAAVERYEVHHPVLDDPGMVTWDQYAVRAWPTLAVVDPEGYVVHVASGEGHADGLARVVEDLVAEHEAKGTLHRGDGPYVPPPAAETALRFPGKVALLPDGSLLVSDTAHHQLVQLAADGETELRRFGSGRRGDPFTEPQGVCVMPRERFGVDVVVADTALRDGPALEAVLAQPSGLAVDRDRLWFADAETSALRWYEDGLVDTAIGTGLFDFGHRDGPAGQALLQHPLGVTVLVDGSVAVLDTYNDAVRRYDPATREVTTLATGVREPSGAVLVEGALVVVASAAHRLERPVAPGAMARVQGEARRTQRPATDVAAGQVEIEVVFEPPKGQHLDEREGPATRLTVSASPAELLLAGGGTSTGLSRRIVLADGIAKGVLHVAAMAASCDEGVEHPACHVTQQDWGIPVRLSAGGAARVGLVLRGLDA
ncbi:MAG: redoxin domain-containing protein [Actinobacteria bacterium]|nr:redoxin domain-containing protein [Actinomycetota bacterium]